MSKRGRLPWAALGFALAAAASSWNPVSAPFGLVVGVASLVLGIRSLRGGGRPAAWAVVVSSAAIVASVLVLALTVGVGRNLAGEPIVEGLPAGGAASELDAASERTRSSRERARRELEALEGAREQNGRKSEPRR